MFFVPFQEKKMTNFTEKQQRELHEAAQHLMQSIHHLSMAIVSLEQAIETLKPFKQNLSAFQTLIARLNTFITKVRQAHESIERSLPTRSRQPKFTVKQEELELATPWLTPARILWIAAGVVGIALVIWFARYVRTGMYGF